MRIASPLFAIALTFFPAVSSTEAAEPIPLRAGPLTLLFDTDLAFVRYVKVGQHEVLRGINAPIRNDIWGTVVPEVSDLTVKNNGDHFSVSFDAICREPGLDFRWRGQLTGTPDGQVLFTFDGVAHSTFKRNRIGFCILHGPSAAGQPWEIEHIDGRKMPGQFPSLISPHQPAKNIRAISHTVADGIQAHVRMEGDTWEMEDQRNWTDASFKTYCTPLEIPYPVEIPEGTRISQRVTIHVDGDLPADPQQNDIITLTALPGDSSSDSNPQTSPRLPRVGLQVSSESDVLSDVQVKRLKSLKLDHLRIDPDLSDPSLGTALRSAGRQAVATGAHLHIGLHLGTDPAAELDRLLAELKSCPAEVSAFLILGATSEHYKLAKTRLRADYPQALVATGYDTNFVDLNRDRPAPGTADAVTWAINPQIHAFDNASIVESLPIHTTTLETARAFCRQPDSASGTDAPPMLIGPITLRSPHMGRDPLPGQLPPDVDLRQPSLFAAAWTASSLHHLARGSAASVTLFETAGWKGIMDLDHPLARPGDFPSTPGKVYAVYHILRAMADFPQARVQPLASSQPLIADGLWFEQDNRSRLLAVNFTDQERLIQLPFQGKARMRLLETTNVNAANQDPETWHGQSGHTVAGDQLLQLPPYAIAVIDRSTD